MIKKGKILGAGAFSTVYECMFIDKKAALKMFRNSEKEKIFREIEMLFSLRHPNIIGMYGWFEEAGGLSSGVQQI